MEEGYYKFSSTEGYLGLENIQIIKNIPYTRRNILIRSSKKKYRYTKYLKKQGKLPEIWNEDFLKIHNLCYQVYVAIDTELIRTVGSFQRNSGKSRL